MSKLNPLLNARNEAAVGALIQNEPAQALYKASRTKATGIAAVAKRYSTTKAAVRAAAVYW